MKKKEIIVDVDVLGNVSIEANNFTDNSCVKATSKLIDGLGGEVTSFEKKDLDNNVRKCNKETVSLRG
jgi:hypothetical protein